MGHVEYANCKGTKLNGEPCTKPGAKRNQGYCSHHKYQINSDTKPIDKDKQIAILLDQVNRLTIENDLLKSLVK